MNFLNLLGIDIKELEKAKEKAEEALWQVKRIYEMVDEIAVDVKYIRSEIDEIHDLLEEVIKNVQDGKGNSGKS